MCFVNKTNQNKSEFNTKRNNKITKKPHKEQLHIHPYDNATQVSNWFTVDISLKWFTVANNAEI